MIKIKVRVHGGIILELRKPNSFSYLIPRKLIKGGGASGGVSIYPCRNIYEIDIEETYQKLKEYIDKKEEKFIKWSKGHLGGVGTLDKIFFKVKSVPHYNLLYLRKFKEVLVLAKTQGKVLKE